MNISFDKTSNVSAVITINIEKADYEAKVTKKLKDITKVAQMPGFRKGHVPAGLVKRMHGAQVKYEEVNRTLNDSLFNYIKENKLAVLGTPLPNEQQETQDIENQENFEFKFDIALAPEFSIEYSASDKLPYYDIQVKEEDITAEVNRLCQQAGHPESVDAYEDKDILRGTLAELGEDGLPLEGGVQVETASLMPTYFKNEDQKAIFNGAKKNDVITFNPATAYDNNETELASLFRIAKEETKNHTGNFSFQVNEISRFVPAELNQELFDKYYGEGVVKSEEELRAKIKENISKAYEGDSDFKFMLDVRKHAMEKVGELEFPEELLKRIINSNKKDEKQADITDEEFKNTLESLKWNMITEKLTAKYEIKYDDKEIKAEALNAARYEFMRYGLNNIPDEYLQNYASEMLKKQDRVEGLINSLLQKKLCAALKNVVTMEHKQISVEDFTELVKE